MPGIAAAGQPFLPTWDAPIAILATLPAHATTYPRRHTVDPQKLDAWMDLSFVLQKSGDARVVSGLPAR